MQNLKIIENELIPVYQTSTREKVVYGTELHSVLEVKSNYREWINRRLSDIDAVKNEDYQGVEISTPSGQFKKDHIIKLDTAKEMAMLERNEKGKQVRRYFIQIEKKYKENTLADLSPELQAIFVHDKKIQKVEKKIHEVDADLQEFKRNLPLLPAEAEQITIEINKRVVPMLGGKESNAYKDNSLRGKVYSDIHRELKRQFGVTKYKYIKSCQLELALSVIRSYELPIILQEQIKDCNAQITMEVA